MRVPGLKAGKSAARWLRSRVVDSAVILGYHRVAEAAWDPYALCVSPDHFAEQLEVLLAQTTPLSLRELVRALRDGSLPPRAEAVTFDDGYADVLHQARPLLERHQVPGVAYVVSGCLGREFWWDELARLLAPDQQLPPELCLGFGDKSRKWRLGSNVEPDRRQRLAHELHGLLVRSSPAARSETIEQLFAAVGVPDGAPRNRVVDRDELLRLTRGGLVEVGAHTSTHPVLAELAVADQQLEIQTSKQTLEEVLDRPVSSFSYPNGALTERTTAIVRGSGFEFACSSEPDVASRRSDPFRLPRFWVPDCDGAQFERWLARWV
jgi:peptidoglycan/xylan/chitin deacetylase (PgdA/CDA1 family)